MVVSAKKRNKCFKGIESERKISLDTAVFFEGMAFRRSKPTSTEGKLALAEGTASANVLKQE